MCLIPKRTPLVLLLLFPLFLQAQEPLPNTLLWRIDNPSGGKPSWLMGTIHVQDRRVFHFTDSLYEALGRADAFAMELDPDTLVQAIFAQLNGRSDKGSRMIKDQVGDKTWAELRPKLRKISGKDPDRMTVDEGRRYYRKRSTPLAKDDDMPTIMDLYLSSIAKDMGKPVTGLEKFADQSSLLDDLNERFDPAKLSGGRSTFEPAMEKMIRVYAESDLDGLYAITKSFDPEEMDRLLVQRNRKMADRMDSLMHTKGIFFAVGAAHLPGSEGLIEALRRRGYAVSPVFSANRLAPDHYVFQRKEEWGSYSDPYQGWVISLPGKPFPVNTGKSFDMTGYMDVADMRMYFLAGVDAGDDRELLERDTVLINRLRSAYDSRSAIHIDSLVRVHSDDSTRVWELIGAETGSGYSIRMRIILRSGNMFLVCLGARHAAEIRDARAERYMSSFKALPTIRGFRPFTDSALGFTVLMPGQTKKNLSRRDSTVAAWHYTCGTTVDGMAANLIVVTTAPNHVITSDSSYFRSSVNNILDEEMKLVRQADTVVNGQHAMIVEFLSGDDAFLNHMHSVKRGGRIITLLATEDAEKPSPAARERYFSSLRLMDPDATDWAQRPVPGTDLQVYGPSDWSLLPPEPEVPHGAVFLAYDERSSVSYNLYLDTLNRYVWSTNDSLLIDRQLSSYRFAGQEELERHGIRTSSGARCLAMTTRVEDSRQVKRVQICLQGDRLHTATAYLPQEWADRPEVDAFFASTVPPQATDAQVLSTREPDRIFRDLRADRSDIRDTAYEALDRIGFPAGMFPVLMEEVVKGFPQDSLNGTRIQDELVSLMEDLADSSAPLHIRRAWPRLAKEQEDLRYDLLNMVAGLKTREAFALIPVLLREHLPTKSGYFLYFRNLLDTLSLAHGIWKDLLPFCGDSLFGTSAFRLHKALIDSGFITLEEFRSAFPRMQGALEHFDRLMVRDAYAPFSFWGRSTFDLLGRLNDAPSRAWLRRYLRSPSSGGRLYAALELMKQGQSVDQKVWVSIAKDKETRLDLYDELTELDRMKYFPKEYKNRQRFAESHAWLLAEDDYAPKSIHFLREVTTEYAGKACTFLLFRISVEDDEGDYSVLAVVGPYKPGSKDLLPVEEDDVSGIVEDEYTPGLELRQLGTYLKQFEEEMAEDPK